MTQSNYVTKLAETYLPEGLLTSVRSARVPYSDSLESVILDAMLHSRIRTLPSGAPIRASREPSFV